MSFSTLEEDVQLRRVWGLLSTPSKKHARKYQRAFVSQPPASGRSDFEDVTFGEGEVSRSIAPANVQKAFARLGKKIKKAEAEEMIWEVNDSMGGELSWDEFKACYLRCKNDSTCIEPRRLYYLISFMIYDRDDSGEVSLEELMHLILIQHGKEALQSELESMFPKEQLSKYMSGKQNVTFKEYVASAEKRANQLLDKNHFKLSGGQLVPKIPIPNW